MGPFLLDTLPQQTLFLMYWESLVYNVLGVLQDQFLIGTFLMLWPRLSCVSVLVSVLLARS